MTNLSNIAGHIYGLIAEIAAAEKITKVKLAQLSREMLPYVMDTQDINAVNRLLSVLTPQNRKVSILFFTHFLPWDAERNSDNVFQRFGKKSKSEKKVHKCEGMIKAWLKDETNTIWTWADQNIEVELKKKDFTKTITRTVMQAIAGDEKTKTPPLPRDQVLAAVFAAGVSIDDMMNAIATQEQIEAERQKQAEAIMSAANAMAKAPVEEQVAAMKVEAA